VGQKSGALASETGAQSSTELFQAPALRLAGMGHDLPEQVTWGFAVLAQRSESLIRRS
jgi:hypothetical protein